MATQPNIVWVFPDEWRHDAAGFAGNEVVQTPHLDALAARGARFTSAHTESPVCQSARAALLAGRFPRDTGINDNQHLARVRPTGEFPPPEAPSFLHALQGAGYVTAEIGKMHFGRGSIGDGIRAWGFDDSAQEHDKYVLWRLDTPYTRHLKAKGLFDAWQAHNSSLLPWIPTTDGRMEPNPLANAKRPKGEPDVVAEEDALDAFIGDSACRWLRAYDRPDPFMLWVAPIGPHSPFDAGPSYTSRYAAADIPLGPLGLDEIPDNRWGEYFRWNLSHLKCERWTEDDFRLIGTYYYGLITQIDDVVGRIVATLAETGRDRDTWIVVSSDHGELLGDHGLISKRVFYETSVRVPQLVVPPVGSGYEPVVVDAQTQAFDVVGTIADLAGASLVDAPDRADSLLPALTGGDVGRALVYSEIAGFLMVRSPEAKLVVHEETLEPGAFYDLREDPDERVNLVDNPGAKAAVEDLAAAAHDFLARRTPLMA